MICFNCGLKQDDRETKECRMCGAKFAFKCHVCEFPNPLLAKYCLNCGNKLLKGGIYSSVQNFDTLAENRRNVAVVFADVSGFTSLSEKLDPEEVRDIINDCFNYITRPVYELDGIIDKYIGDCVMILFGAKYSHGDDAKRAVMCAMKMAELVRRFSEERLSASGFSLSLSIGINYGLVVTGSVGNLFDKDYTVMGDIVNTAQRLQSNAGKGKILVAEAVYFETKDMVSYSGVVELAVKNKDIPVRCYYPDKLKPGYSLKNETVFTGRKNEIKELYSALNRSFSNRIQCVSITGDAGMGKTRLVKEFSEGLNRGIKRVRVDCNPFSRGKVNYIVSGILTAVMNMSPEDSAYVKKSRLVSFVNYVLPGAGYDKTKRNCDFLGLILGLERDNEFCSILDSMTFENLRKELLRQLAIFFAGYCRKNKALFIVEDIHWADTNSLEILRDLIPLLRTCGCLFIFTSRCDIECFGEIEPDLFSTLRLKALSAGDSKKLLCSLFQSEDVDNALLEAVLEHTKGNTLYMREFAGKIKKSEGFFVSGGVAQINGDGAVAFPDSIQSLILSKLSELDDKSRDFLQAASVIGKDFSLSLASCLLEYETDFDEAIQLPLQLNLISLNTVNTFEGMVDKVFSFNQEIEREAIYESILNKNKRQMHARLGENMEQRHLKDIEDHVETLFLHFQKAGLIKKAADYCYKTAKKYKRDFVFNSSREYFEKFIDMAASAVEAGTDPRVLDSLKEMGHISFITAKYDAAMDYLSKALKMAHGADDIHIIKIMTADIYKAQGLFEQALAILDELRTGIRQDNDVFGRLLQMKCSILRIKGDSEALALAKRSEKILLKTRDYQNLSETMRQAGIIYFSKGDIDNSLFYLNKSFSYAERVNNLEVMTKASGNLGIVYLDTGMVSKAQHTFTRSMELAGKISDLQAYTSSCINLGVLYLDSKGLFNKAEILLNEALEISTDISSRLYQCACLTNLGDVMYEKGLFEKALDYYAKSLELSVNINSQVDEGVNNISMARVYLKTGEYEKLPEKLDSAFNIFSAAGEMYYLCDYYRYISLYRLKTGNSQAALESCDRAVSYSMECRSGRRRAQALRFKGILLASLEDHEAAVKLLGESIAVAEQMESDYEAAKGYFRRYEVLSRLKRNEAALADLNKAAEYINKIDNCRWTGMIRPHHGE